MNLNEVPEIVTWGQTHYVYVEKVGPFQENAPAAWHTLFQVRPRIAQSNTILGSTSLYRLEPEPVYRAGLRLADPAKDVPQGFDYTLLPGGKYACFTLIGSYSQLPEATGRVFERVQSLKFKVRPDFFLENYVSDFNVTPEAELVTQILIPVN
jgi:DNA gyrase inhibitor GyrI